MIKSFIQGFLPGIALKIFLIVLPTILMFMSKFEGLISQSSLERRSASKYYIFLFFNVFLGSVITGSALEQLKTYLHKSANEYVLVFCHPVPPHLLMYSNCLDIAASYGYKLLYTIELSLCL
jgi:calcium permeable stress-gated cation channel